MFIMFSKVLSVLMISKRERPPGSWAEHICDIRVWVLLLGPGVSVMLRFLHSSSIWEFMSVHCKQYPRVATGGQVHPPVLQRKSGRFALSLGAARSVVKMFSSRRGSG